MLVCSNVTHHYSVRPVLRDVDFRIAEGECVAVLGPNGMGKTTLLAILGGAVTPTFGTVEINGRIRRSTVEEELAIRKECVYLPDDCWLPRRLTGSEWLLDVGRLYEIPVERLYRHANLLIDVFNLTDVAHQSLSSCSAGQRKKWMLASALLTDARVLLLDEPYSGGLDPAGILALQRILRRLTSEEGRTIIFTTPVPELVEGTADRLLVVQDGRIAADERLSDLRERSQNGAVTPLLQEMFFNSTLTKLDRYFQVESEAAG
ncbi:MAG: ABC transporter ATP-binding protein [Planctomyces sp.]|nr:ABC transporter ATP-binding protein [Planctomyces sp.]